jgi:hypothetical protein
MQVKEIAMNLSASYNKIKYVTDPAGKRKEVIVPFSFWTSLTEELEALKEKQKILLGLRQACREVKKQQKGILKEKNLDEFLDEL